MTIDSIRRQNLKTLSIESGGIGRLAERLGKDPSQVSQWINASPDSRTGKPRGIRSATCRDIELRLGKPEGWMDWPGDDVSLDTGTDSGREWPFPTVSLDDIARLTENDRRDLETTIKRFVAGCLAQDPSGAAKHK